MSRVDANGSIHDRQGRFDGHLKSEADVDVLGGEVRDLSDQPPVQIDTQLADLYRRKALIRDRIGSRKDRAHDLVGDGYRRLYVRGSGWKMTWDEVEAKTDAVLADPAAFRRHEHVRNREELAELQGKLAGLIAEEEPLEAEFVRRGGWSRAFLVANGDGHVHSSMDCSTCNRGERQTQFQWMINYSGGSEDEIVADAGYRACTVCFPSAPVGDARSLPTRMFTDDEVVAAKSREERAAAKLARDAKRIEAALTPDGSEFVVQTEVPNSARSQWGQTERFKTERAAMTWALNHTASRRFWLKAEHMEPTYQVRDEAVRQILQAVADKHGQPVEDATAEFERKIAAKAKRDGWAK
mgnify:CR=1 FL=1